jgi:hypothetical protein
MLTAVLFNLPDSLIGSPTLPYDAKVVVVVDSVDEPFKGDLRILDGTGAPISFSSASPPEDLAPAPALRLRAKKVSSGIGFDPAWDIAGIEFVLEFFPATSAISNPDVFVGNEAHRAVAIAGPETTPGSVKITVVDPHGFTLGTITESPSRVGTGALLDIVFDKETGQGFDEGDFTIRGLKVTDPDGVLLSPAMLPTDDATAYFELNARANLP